MDFDAVLKEQIRLAKRKKMGADPVPTTAAVAPAAEHPMKAPPAKDATLSLNPSTLMTITESEIDARLVALLVNPQTLPTVSRYEKLLYLNRLEARAALNAAVEAQRVAEEPFERETISVEDIQRFDAGRRAPAPDGSVSDLRLRLCLLNRIFYKRHLRQLPEVKQQLVPLLSILRLQTITDEKLLLVLKITQRLVAQDPQGATQEYMALSIGNKKWPLGVGNIGIHARSSDAKLFVDDRPAGGLDESVERAWIVGIKRVINHVESNLT